MANHDLQPTLVMGARGSVGKHVLGDLIARRLPVRASARRPEPGRFPADVDVRAATGKDIAVDALTREGALRQFSRFMPVDEAEAVVRFLDDAAAGNSPATDTVEQVLGRPAADFGTWAADHAADFQ